MYVRGYQGSTLSWAISSVVVAVVFVSVLTGRWPWDLADEILGPGRRFSEQDAALMRAAQQGDDAGVRQALAAGARVNALRPDDRLTPLIVAAQASEPVVLNTLLAAGADHTIIGGTNVTALDEAVAHGSPEAVRALIAVKPNLSRAGGEREWTPLARAIHRYVDASPAPRQPGNPEELRTALQIVDDLLGAGADPSLGETGPAGDSPLALAAFRGLDRIATRLLAAGADAKGVRASTGDTILGAAVQACSPGTPAVVRALLAHGADPDARGPGGQSARDRRAAQASTSEACQSVLTALAAAF